MKVELTENESLLIYHAAWLVEGFLDFENNNDDEFVYRYGLSKENVDAAKVSLRKKFKDQSKKLKS